MTSPITDTGNANSPAGSTSAPRASAMIPPYNMPDALARCLQSIVGHCARGGLLRLRKVQGLILADRSDAGAACGDQT